MTKMRGEQTMGAGLESFTLEGYEETSESVRSPSPGMNTAIHEVINMDESVIPDTPSPVFGQNKKRCKPWIPAVKSSSSYSPPRKRLIIEPGQNAQKVNDLKSRAKEKAFVRLKSMRDKRKMKKSSYDFSDTDEDSPIKKNSRAYLPENEHNISDSESELEDGISLLTVLKTPSKPVTENLDKNIFSSLEMHINKENNSKQKDITVTSLNHPCSVSKPGTLTSTRPELSGESSSDIDEAEWENFMSKMIRNKSKNNFTNCKNSGKEKRLCVTKNSGINSKSFYRESDSDSLESPDREKRHKKPSRQMSGGNKGVQFLDFSDSDEKCTYQYAGNSVKKEMTYSYDGKGIDLQLKNSSEKTRPRKNDSAATFDLESTSRIEAELDDILFGLSPTHERHRHRHRNPFRCEGTSSLKHAKNHSTKNDPLPHKSPQSKPGSPDSRTKSHHKHSHHGNKHDKYKHDCRHSKESSSQRKKIKTSPCESSECPSSGSRLSCDKHQSLSHKCSHGSDRCRESRRKHDKYEESPKSSHSWSFIRTSKEGAGHEISKRVKKKPAATVTRETSKARTESSMNVMSRTETENATREPELDEAQNGTPDPWDDEDDIILVSHLSSPNPMNTTQVREDELMARRLQEEMDREYASSIMNTAPSPATSGHANNQIGAATKGPGGTNSQTIQQRIQGLSDYQWQCHLAIFFGNDLPSPPSGQEDASLHDLVDAQILEYMESNPNSFQNHRRPTYESDGPPGARTRQQHSNEVDLEEINDEANILLGLGMLDEHMMAIHNAIHDRGGAASGGQRGRRRRRNLPGRNSLLEQLFHSQSEFINPIIPRTPPGRQGRRRRRGAGRQNYQDDIDLNDFEALWDLANVLGEGKKKGLSKAQIRALPTKTFDQSQVRPGDETPSCNVCMAEYENHDNLRILPCFHSFHQTCIDTWIKDNNTCPICRVEIRI